MRVAAIVSKRLWPAPLIYSDQARRTQDFRWTECIYFDLCRPKIDRTHFAWDASFVVGFLHISGRPARDVVEQGKLRNHAGTRGDQRDR